MVFMTNGQQKELEITKVYLDDTKEPALDSQPNLKRKQSLAKKGTLMIR